MNWLLDNLGAALIGAVVSTLFTILWQRFNIFYLFYHRIIFYLLNRTCYWRATFKIYQNDINADEFMDQIVSAIRNIFQGKAKIKIDNRNEKEFILDRTRFGLSLLSENGILLHTEEHEIGYRNSLKKISKNFHGLIRGIEEETKIVLEVYSSLTVEFEEKNPYLTLYLKRVSKKKIDTFECRYTLKHNGYESKITINKNNVTIVANDMNTWYKHIKGILLLSSKLE